MVSLCVSASCPAVSDEAAAGRRREAMESTLRSDDLRSSQSQTDNIN